MNQSRMRGLGTTVHRFVAEAASVEVRGSWMTSNAGIGVPRVPLVGATAHRRIDLQLRFMVQTGLGPRKGAEAWQATAQTKPASSRATATQTLLSVTPRACSLA